MPQCDGAAADAEQYHGLAGDSPRQHAHVLRAVLHESGGDHQPDCGEGTAVLRVSIPEGARDDLQESRDDRPEHVEHISAKVIGLVGLQAAHRDHRVDGVEGSGGKWREVDGFMGMRHTWALLFANDNIVFNTRVAA